MILALVLALLSGALLALLICKAIHLKLWLDLTAGVGGLAGLYASAKLSEMAGGDQWPLLGVPISMLLTVAYLKYWRPV